MLVMIMLIVLALGAWFYRSQKEFIRTEAEHNLRSIAQLKVNQVVAWQSERVTRATSLTENPFIDNSIPDLMQHWDPIQIESISNRLDLLKTRFQFHEIILVTTNGKIKLTLPSAPLTTLSRDTSEALAKAVQTGHPLITDLQAGDESMPPHRDIIVPLSATPDSTTPPLGAVIFRDDARQFLFPMIQTWPIPSPSAETLLVRRDGDSVLYLNELRHTSNTAFKLRIPLTATNVPAVMAVSGQQGYGLGTDYRGRPVVSVIMAIPDTPWFMISKVDQSEIFAEWHRQAILILGLLLCFILFSGTIAVLIWQRNAKTHYRALFQAESARHLSEKIFRDLFESMDELTVLHELVYGPDGKAINYRILDCNPAFTRSTGITREAAVGNLASQVFKSEPPPYLDTYTQVAESGTPIRLETYFPPMEKWFSISAVSPQRGQFATITSDITQRKRAEDEQQRLNLSLQEKNAELESVLYAASHDLRSPLVNVEGFGLRVEKACRELGDILHQAPLPPEHRERARTLVEERIPMALRFSRSGVARMNTLINGLLQLSRLGRVAPHIGPIDMDKLMQQAVDAIRFQIMKIGATITVDPLPPCQGDTTLLIQVFGNLLDNALKYRDPERPLLITISGSIKDTEAVYTVTDTGIGIAPEHQEKIWELFHRLNPAGPVAGEGLGLNYVRRILTLQKGHTWVESTPGIGSRFSVALPHEKN